MADERDDEQNDGSGHVPDSERLDRLERRIDTLADLVKQVVEMNKEYSASMGEVAKSLGEMRQDNQQIIDVMQGIAASARVMGEKMTDPSERITKLTLLFAGQNESITRQTESITQQTRSITELTRGIEQQGRLLLRILERTAPDSRLTPEVDLPPLDLGEAHE